MFYVIILRIELPKKIFQIFMVQRFTCRHCSDAFELHNRPEIALDVFSDHGKRGHSSLVMNKSFYDP